VCRPGQHQQRQHRAVTHHAAHRAADSAQLRKAQRHAALEQDQRHGKRYGREQEFAQCLVGIEQPRRRTQRDPDQQQEQNRRQPHPPRQPLGEETHDQQHGEPYAKINRHATSRPSGSGSMVMATANRRATLLRLTAAPMAYFPPMP